MSDVTGDRGELVAVAGTISGRVHGVGFRASTEWRARALRLHGWVRNLPDGRVEVFAQGSRDHIDEFARWLETGPPAARVGAVRLATVPPDPNLTTFTVRA